jgi:hemerythrin
MDTLKWSASHAVYVPEIDDEHKQIFEAVYNLRQAFAEGGAPAEIRRQTQRLISSIGEHFEHEERLMRAARYGSMRWHKQAHQSARRRVGEFVLRIEQGESGAVLELAEYLTAWLHDHTRLADRMLGAFLRNQQRCMWKMTFRAGTKAADECTWVHASGETFDPKNP